MKKDTFNNLIEVSRLISENHSSWELFVQVFDLLPSVQFYIKDVDGKFLWMNMPLRSLLDIKSETGFLGKTDADFFTSELVFLYRREDKEVISSKKPVLNQPWIVPGRSNQAKWYVSSKFPLFDKDQDVIGTLGIMRNLTHEFESSNSLSEMHEVLDFMFQNYREKINIEELASLAFLSARQFERKFQKIFFRSPSDFILKIRIDASVRLLIETELSITQVAMETGFYDNSHFTRQFKKTMGLSPVQFRKKYAKSE